MPLSRMKKPTFVKPHIQVLSRHGIEDSVTIRMPKRQRLFNAYYGWAVSQYLPLNDFKWVDFLDVHNVDENGGKGYILEVDLEYPESLHDDRSDLPLAPESSVTPPPHIKKRDY
ncbi:hypothetical protein TNCV_2614351 [Trichonephila clavipes]|nr:hypothetical protein TNCV_2614351 [Trichonephila clavipes]